MGILPGHGTLTKCSLCSWLCVSVFSSPVVLRLPQNQNHGVIIPPVTMERVAFQQDIHHTTTERLVVTTTQHTTTERLVVTTTQHTTTEAQAVPLKQDIAVGAI